MQYKCRRCGRSFCSDHRLPENHNCPGLPNSRGHSGEKWFKGNPSQGQKTLSNAKQASTSSWLSNVATIVIVAGLVAALVGGGVYLNSTPEAVPEVDFSGGNVSGTENQGSTASTSSGWGGLFSENNPDEERVEQLIHEGINAYRTNQSAGSLEYDSELAEIAEYHSANMAANGDIYHTSPSGETVGDRYNRFGYDCRVPTGGNQYRTSGENVAKTWYEEELTNGDYYGTPEELAAGIVDQLINSEPHRQNLVNSDWRREGIGVNITEEDEGTAVYVTQNFC